MNGMLGRAVGLVFDKFLGKRKKNNYRGVQFQYISKCSITLSREKEHFDRLLGFA
jgi:hypothetical protein